jgi:SAM-dependent methyltransferase
MSIADTIHERYLRGRRARVLSESIAGLIPRDARVLDVGSGDGEIAHRINLLRPDVTVEGIDVLVRPRTAIPVTEFDGDTFPFEAGTFDTITIVDVLHHTHNPVRILHEARRIARTSVVVKDHVLCGTGAGPTLRFMDRVGNERHGVVSPYNYLTYAEWESAFDEADLSLKSWEDDLGIYAWPATLLFDRKLHFTAALAV